jgi:hypothetical protein
MDLIISRCGILLALSLGAPFGQTSSHELNPQTKWDAKVSS